jgi:hypothetical protein
LLSESVDEYCSVSVSGVWPAVGGKVKETFQVVGDDPAMTEVTGVGLGLDEESVYVKVGGLGSDSLNVTAKLTVTGAELLFWIGSWGVATSWVTEAPEVLMLKLAPVVIWVPSLPSASTPTNEALAGPLGVLGEMIRVPV